EDARDLRLEARCRHVHALMARAHGIADPRDHVCDRISHVLYLPTPPVSCRSSSRELPAALDDTGDFAAERELPEAQPAQRELAQIGPRPSALPAAIPMPDLVLRCLVEVFDALCRSCHRVVSCVFAVT